MAQLPTPLLLLPLLACGCYASLDGGEPSDSEPSKPSAPSEEESPDEGTLPDLTELDCSEVPIDPGEAPLRLLTRKQYLRTVESLIGTVPELETTLPTYVAPSGLGIPEAPVNAVQVEGLSRAAELIATRIVTDQALLDALAPCAEDATPSEQRSCATSFVQGFVARAYRTELREEDDLENHLVLFDVGAETSYVRGIELLLRGVFQAPRFLYQVEIGTSDAVSETAVRLRPEEMAARLSYSLWNSPPDDALVTAARAGELNSPDGVLVQVERMLADPQGTDFVRNFLRGFAEIHRIHYLAKDPEMYPEFDSLKDSLDEQANAFFDHILTEEGGRLSALLTSPAVLANDVLAPFYSETASSDFSVLEEPSGTFSGLLTLPAWLAVHSKPDQSSPIHRGLFIRESLFCQHPPAPPPDIPQPPTVDSGGTTRERLAQHVSEPGCAGCHELLDPLGLGLESYDALGFYRELDAGQPVDNSGELVSTDVDGPFVGAVELGERLASSAEVEQCFTRKWFRFVQGRIEKDADACSVKSLLTHFQNAGQDMTELPKAMAQTDAFLYRRPSDAEIKP